VKKGTKDCISKNILHRLFIGDKLETLLESSAPDDPELEEDLSSENEAEDQAEIESDSESEPDPIVVGLQPSRKDNTSYKAFLRPQINQRHRTDGVLQCRDASQVVCGAGRIHATFCCPVCHHEFDAVLLVCKFYQHIEQPSHWQYFIDNGLPCKFGCDRRFLDETHRFVHQQTGRCPGAKKYPAPLFFNCPKLINAGENYDACNHAG